MTWQGYVPLHDTISCNFNRLMRGSREAIYVPMFSIVANPCLKLSREYHETRQMKQEIRYRSVFRINDILVWIRIRGCMAATNGYRF